MYTCAYCGVLACQRQNPDKIPENCPMGESELNREILDRYNDEGVREFFVASSEIEALGYCHWPRLREVMEFCHRLHYRRVGMAFCSGLRREARVIQTILEKNGLEVVSVICKTGGTSKERVGVPEEYKLRPGSFEAMCNPIGQAMLLNRQNTQFNMVVGLCVGHDSLFYRHSDAPVTTLIAKDRVTGHNPAAAVYCADSYFGPRLTTDSAQ